jgi:hypothetical protein
MHTSKHTHTHIHTHTHKHKWAEIYRLAEAIKRPYGSASAKILLWMLKEILRTLELAAFLATISARYPKTKRYAVSIIRTQKNL